MPRKTRKPAAGFQRLVITADDFLVLDDRATAVLADRLAVDRHGVLMDEALGHQLVDDGRDTARMIVVFAEIFAGRLQVDEQRHFLAIGLPVVDGEFDADMAGERVQMDRRIGRATDRRIDADRVDEGFLGQDVGGLQVFLDHFDDAKAGQVGDLLPIAIRRRDRRRTGKLHAERFGERIHRRRRAHRVAVAGGRRRGGDQLDEAGIIDLALGEQLTGLPDDRAGTGTLAAEPAVQHRTDGQRDRWNIDRRRRHQTGRRGLVAADRQNDAVERIAVEHLDQAEIGEVAVKAGGRTLAGFLDRMDREFDGNAAGFADTLAQTMRQFQMMPVARRKIGTRLGDADDRPVGLQFGLAETEIHVALEIKRRHVDIRRVVEPRARTELADLLATLVGFGNLVRGYVFGIGHHQSSNTSV